MVAVLKQNKGNMFKHVDVVVLTVDETPVRALLSSAAREREHLSNLRTPLKEAVTDTKNRQRILDPFPGKKKKKCIRTLWQITAAAQSSLEVLDGPSETPLNLTQKPWLLV